MIVAATEATYIMLIQYSFICKKKTVHTKKFWFHYNHQLKISPKILVNKLCSYRFKVGNLLYIASKFYM